MLKEASILGYESPRVDVVIAGTATSRRNTAATRRKAASAVLPRGQSIRGARWLSDATSCIRVPQIAVSNTIHAMLLRHEGKGACHQPSWRFRFWKPPSTCALDVDRQSSELGLRAHSSLRTRRGGGGGSGLRVYFDRIAGGHRHHCDPR